MHFRSHVLFRITTRNSKPNLARYSDTRQNRYGFSEIRNFAYFLVIKICTRILVISHDFGFLETFEIRKHLICFVIFFLIKKNFLGIDCGQDISAQFCLVSISTVSKNCEMDNTDNQIRMTLVLYIVKMHFWLVPIDPPPPPTNPLYEQ